ncbi:hypothetical protein AnigIFM56816_004854 [Aspergillus niger]|nr:hypothetical protein AnigIFM56816_004854 [Aspergillus niger]
MASHQLAIAKASFSAGLLRPDPTSVARDEITAFHTSLDRALSHCTPANIQTCKQWLLEYVVSSGNRVGGWAKYLAALSGSFESSSSTPSPAETGGKRSTSTSGKRKRLHILYLLNDVLHHTKYHLDTTAAFSTLSGSLQPHVVELLGYAASYDREKNPKHHRRLDELLDIWEENRYYGSDYVNKLREVVKNASVSGPVKTSLSVEESNVDFSGAGAKPMPSGKDVPFVMPATHGDPSMPYYDLPAGNLVPHIIPDSTVPLRPESIKPLQFLAGPADENLVVALKKFLKDVDRIYGTGEPEHEEDEVVDIDDLGQVVVRDADGEVIEGETYYGWSRSFCQQMKKRQAKGDMSRSRSRSRSPVKRRRYSDSASDWSSRSRSRTRSPQRRSRRRDSRSRTRSPYRPRSASRSKSRERSKSYSPRPPAPRSIPPPPEYHNQPQYPPPHNAYGNTAPPPPPPPVGYHAPPPPPPQMGYPSAAGVPPHFAFPPGGPAPPPPPPPNYQGTWPPPPPPAMNLGAAHPPPPPPPHAAHQGSHFPPPYGQGQYVQQMPPGSYHFPPPHPGRGGWYGGGGGGRGGQGWR